MLSSELNPSNGMASENAITFRADNNGHYRVNAEINGEKVDFMIDTGATSVVLTMNDAEKIGFNLDDLTFVAPASTANWVVYNAPIRLNALSVGPIRVESVEGFVNQGELDISLLGMSFLNRLSGYEVENGLLTLYP
ncbi:MAG: TIGR02281 family clan AA aspartic protease [Kordiimonadaceae bacterium]|nr:TIGR02281 family clan AA aspartic protease [Kordiimonadaceae bacterium]